MNLLTKLHRINKRPKRKAFQEKSFFFWTIDNLFSLVSSEETFWFVSLLHSFCYILILGITSTLVTNPPVDTFGFAYKALNFYLFSASRIEKMKIFLRCFKPKFYKKWLAFFVLCRMSVEVFLLTIVVEMKCSKSATSYMKIRLEIVRKRRIAMIKFLKMDIVEFLKNGLDYDAYRRVRTHLPFFL